MRSVGKRLNNYEVICLQITIFHFKQKKMKVGIQTHSQKILKSADCQSSHLCREWEIDTKTEGYNEKRNRWIGNVERSTENRKK